MFILHVIYNTCCLSYMLFITHGIYPTYCLSYVLFILRVVNRSCYLSYLFNVRVIYPTCCLSYVLFTLMWFIAYCVYPTCCLSYYCLSCVLFILHVIYRMLYIVTSGLDDWVTDMLKQYVFWGFILPALWHRKCICQRPLCFRDMVNLVMALDVVAAVLYCRDYEWNVSYW
jgi:hypothetical protein